LLADERILPYGVSSSVAGVPARRRVDRCPRGHLRVALGGVSRLGGAAGVPRAFGVSEMSGWLWFGSQVARGARAGQGFG